MFKRAAKNLAVVTLLLFSCLSLADVKIGNGGEGIEENGRLYLRDFYFDGHYRAPDVRQLEGSASPIWLNSDLPLDSRLLEAQLLAIDLISKDLALSIREVLKGCWVATEAPLWLVDAADNVPGQERVPVAVRGVPFKFCTSVNRPNWMRLSNLDRVGLLIHESVSTIVRPKCEGVICRQNSALIREIVSFLFFTKDGRSLSLIHRQALRIWGDTLRTDGDKMHSIVVVKRGTQVITGRLTSAWIPTDSISFAERTCRGLKDGAVVHLSRPKECSVKRLDGGNDHSQIYQQATIRPAKRAFLLLPGEDCLSKFRAEVESWFGSYVGHPHKDECF